jgi:hypothetical protein
MQETPIGEVIEGMENVEQLYSYGDMPPWGKGPVQGKIHGHPEYIEENFPDLDKFIRCKVERLNVEQEGGIVYKADHKTDEEEFAQQREEEPIQREEEPIEPDAGEKRILLQVPPHRPHLRDQPGLPAGMDPFTTYSGVAILAVMGVAMLLIKSRKKEDAKSN